MACGGATCGNIATVAGLPFATLHRQNLNGLGFISGEMNARADGEEIE